MRLPEAADIIWALVGLTCPALAGAQESTIRVTALAGTVRLDGLPDEAAWYLADSLTDLTQREPTAGTPASQRTVVRFLAAPGGLYVGLWACDSAPGSIRHAQLRRDADFSSDDSFSLLLDPQRDRRSGYLLSVNPNGAMFDSEVRGADDDNPDWDGVWDARARITPEGWTAELFIPWQTLRYRPGESAWGMNLRRFIRQRNEEVLWRAWPRQQGLLFQQEEGTLEGLDQLPGRHLLELRPYILASATLDERSFRPSGADSVIRTGSTDLKTGLDAKLAVAPTLTIDLTVNTDFAQVDADRQVVNLTRFPLFFPEKRPFFLEGSGTFDFGQSERNTLFYSRRIGLDDAGSAVPLVAGVRLQGRVGHERVGLLAARTGGSEAAWDLVARVKHDVLSRGFAGLMGTLQRTPDGPTRLSAGADLQLPFLVGGQNLVFSAFGAGTRDSAGGAVSTSWRLFLDYPNDWSDDFLALSRIEAGYDPALGFVRETGILRHTGAFRLSPRPAVLGIRRLDIKLLEWDVTSHLDGHLSHSFFEVRPLGAEFASGDAFEFNLQRAVDVPEQDFEIFPGSTIPAGRYQFDRAEVQFTTSPGRAVSTELAASAGDYYDGTSAELSSSVDLRVAPHLITGLEYSVQSVHRPGGDFAAQEARLRFDVATSPRLNTTLFLQWENESDRLTVNARVHWIPRPGSDAFLVWSSAWPTGLDHGIHWSRPLRGTLIGKLNYYFRI